MVRTWKDLSVPSVRSGWRQTRMQGRSADHRPCSQPPVGSTNPGSAGMRCARHLVVATLIASGTAGCAYSNRAGAPNEVPVEVFQDCQLGLEYRLAEVQYSFDEKLIATWHPWGPNEPSSPTEPVFQGRVTPGAFTFTGRARVEVQGTASNPDAILSVTQAEPVAAVAGRRLRLVFVLCPRPSADPTRGIRTQVESSLMVSSEGALARSKSECLSP